jgi:hypothetical protein
MNFLPSFASFGQAISEDFYLEINQSETRIAYDKMSNLYRGICEKYQSRDGNLVSRLVFFANNPPKHDISV